MIAVRAGIDDDEAAAAGVLLAHQRQAGRRLIVPLDDDVLQQVAEAGFDRALVAAIDLEVVGDGALLPDAPLACTSTMRAASPKSGAAGGELLERREARLERGSSCSRARTSRMRSSCSMRALASSDSRARALARVTVSRPPALRSPSAAVARSAVDFLALAPRSSCSTSSSASVSPTRSCCVRRRAHGV